MKKAGTGQKRNRSIFRFSTLAFAIHAVSMGGLVTLPMQQAYAQTAGVKSYNIPAGRLANVLNQFAEQSGTSVAMDAQQLQGLHSLGLKGDFAVEQGFEQLLKATEFNAVKVGQGYTLSKKTTPRVTPAKVQATSLPPSSAVIEEDASVRLTPIVVYGKEDRDTEGYNKVYDANRSSVYAGKDYVERFKGTNPADVLQGMVGVYSGDARNSGALDPSVRGVQGVGRVPLTIDGTEQSIAVWRGYNGVNNRNYIDPNLIAGIEVIKGPSLERNTTTSVGGAVVVKTLEADDIVRPGKSFGAELKVEGSTNSIDPSLPDMSKVGQNYDNTTPWIDMNGAKYDPDIYKKNRIRSDNSHFSGDDLAGRLAIATKQDKFDLLAVYAVRERGNYFSGTHGAGYYKRATPDSSLDFIPYFAYAYQPGDEVPNTSSHMESWLLKGTYRPTDDQTLKLTYRDTKNIFGEIMPSRIVWGITPDLGVPQWPLSNIHSKAYSLEYKFKPENNRWIDFYANIWQTDTESQTYTRGGWPTTIDFRDNTIINTAISHSDNTRKGITVSNKTRLLDQLDLTLGGSFLKEKLTSDDIYGEFGPSYSLYQALPRAGRREEKTFDFNFNYRPVSWLSFDAGMRYRSYWAVDDFLNKSLQSEIDPSLNPLFTKKSRLKEYTFEYQTMPESYTSTQQRLINVLKQRYATKNPEWDGQLDTVPASESTLYNMIWSQKNTLSWKADANGQLSLADNPLNQLNASGQKYVVTGGNFMSVVDQVPVESADKVKDSGWAPQLGASIHLTPNSRIYARYAEEYRLPSLFESTVGFSAMLPYQAIKPEHAFNYEVGYVYDMRDWFSTARNADIKLAYYYNKTKNVIERDQNLIFTNMDEQKLSGLELQSRFDNGGFFTDLSVAYNLKNEVCDTNSAINKMILGGTVQTEQGLEFREPYQRCVDDGFPNGYLVTMATPELSFHGLLGARFFDEKLELGARAIFYKAYESPLRKNNDASVNKGYYLNVPLAWDDTWIFDAYARYQVDDYNTVEFVGSNLSNQFYIDPLTRSAMAAPGRTMKISWTTKF
ncbi:TonB-dependent receptor domain-containing protein [Acinetobacter baumannii]|uniref:TonB-dependent receptor domain-containing protein n=1 Tax=Acinetobacter baumannii TaxID=470 RepID=UPI0029CA448F|nr:TonB-dependent receptor [Acinetobacter baumannii]